MWSVQTVNSVFSMYLFNNGGPTWTRTRDQRIMLTTTAFAACFQFVVWTVSCLYDLPVQSLHLPNIATGLGSGLPRCEQHRLPRIWVVLHASRVNLPACNPTANGHDIFDVLGHLLFKSSALTNWAIGPKNWLYFAPFWPKKCCLNFQQSVEAVWKQIFTIAAL